MVFSIAGLALASSAPAASAACTRVASPGQSAQQLVDSLAAGQTGCLRAGTYTQSQLRFSKGGAAGAPITLQSYPGERARVAGGHVYVPAGSNFVTLHGLDIDGAGDGSPTVQVMAYDTVLSGNTFTNRNSGESCVILGSLAGYGQARRTSIRANRFADCGSPSNGLHDHGIYVENSVDAGIVDNLFWHAAAWAVQLYPNATGTHIAHNVMDGSSGGIIIAGEGGGGEYSQDYASSGTLIEQNLITNASAEYNVQSYWGGPKGTGNVVRSNCVFNGARGDIDSSDGGFAATGNTAADPRYVNRTLRDYRMQAGSPCLSVVGYDTAAKLASGDDGGTEPGPGGTLPGLPLPPLPASKAARRAVLSVKGPHRLRSRRPRFRIKLARAVTLKWRLRTRKRVLVRGTRHVRRARTITLRPRVTRRQLRRLRGHHITLVIRATRAT